MADLEEITETPREGGEGESVRPAGEDLPTRAGGSMRQNRKNSSGVDDSGNAFSSGQNRGGSKLYGNGELVGRRAGRKKKEGLGLPQEDRRAKFYEHYRREAKEYDEEFMKKYDEDLNTTLIFAGLFSAVASAFIIQVQSGFQPDPNKETAALLRILIYKIDNTTFGDTVPAIPQPWSGPPHTVVQVQEILFASLAASLFSAFLAMLGKQWLNRYASIDMRGSAIERSQNRQRKLDGIVSWYFDHVLESLPLMLQVALLLLGCALSRYLWETNTAVASVVLGVTSFGVFFYLFIVVAGTVSMSCPYRTPAAHMFRRIPRILSVFHSVIFLHIERSAFYHCLREVRSFFVEAPILQAIAIFVIFIPWLPISLLADVHQLGEGAASLLVVSAHWVYLRVKQGPEQQAAVLDLHCISWTLRKSLDGPVRLSALNYLATVALADFDPTLVAGCLDILVGCVKHTNGNAMITQGSGQLAAASALCCLRTLSHLTAVDRTSRVLEDIRQRYARSFPSETKFDSLPFSHTLAAIHRVFYPTRVENMSFPSNENQITLYTWSAPPVERVEWEDYKPSTNEHEIVAHAFVKLARLEYWRRGDEKVPRWLLRFALHSLSQDLLPPITAVTNCLSIIAIDLGCAFPNPASPDESLQLDEVARLITQRLKTLGEDTHPYRIHSKRKAITALIPYEFWRKRHGYKMLNASLCTTGALKGFIWIHVAPFLPTLSDEASPLAIVLASPHVPWDGELHDKNAVARWAAAVSGVQYTEEVGQSVVDALLQIASVDTLRPYVPSAIWAWFTKHPSLPPECLGRSKGTERGVVRQVRVLGDIEILKSYLLLVWSEWGHIDDQSGGLTEMKNAIREGFGGIGMEDHREDLMKQLDHVLGQLDRGLKYLKHHKPRLDEDDIQRAKGQYGALKKVLLEVDGEAMNILAQSHPAFILPYSDIPLLAFPNSMVVRSRTSYYGNRPARF